MELVNNPHQVICCCSYLSTQLLFHARQLSYKTGNLTITDVARSHQLSDNLKKGKTMWAKEETTVRDNKLSHIAQRRKNSVFAVDGKNLAVEDKYKMNTQR